MLNVILDDVSPLLQRQPTEADLHRVEAWITTINIYLNARYGDRITVDNEAGFLAYIADAVTRKLTNRDPHILSQSVEGASVTYAANSTKGGWFLPSELSEMDELVGKGRAYILRSVQPAHLYNR